MIEQDFNLAQQHHEAGQLAEAEALYRQILSRQPDHRDALHFLGLIELQLEHYDAALLLMNRALALEPDRAEFHANRGVAYLATGNLQQAAESFRRAVELDPDYVEARQNLAAVLRKSGRLDEAVAEYRQIATLRPESAESQNNLGDAQLSAGQIDDAIASFRKALALRPDSPDIQFNLGNALARAHQPDEAIALLRRAEKIRPKDATIHNTLAGALMQKSQYDEAIALLRLTLKLKPDYPGAASDLGNALLAQERIAEAMAAYQAVLKTHPDFAQAHWNYALALLLTGDYSRGWPEFDWRWKLDGYKDVRPDDSRPIWDGSDPAGLRILLYAEQGFGDAIQFFRYASLVSRRGGKVIVRAPKPLLRLFRDSEEITVVPPDAPLPPFDVHYPLMSLPRLFNTTMETIPAVVPYLRTNPELVESWKSRLPADPKRLKVGLAWRGRSIPDPRRSIPLESLAPLREVPDVQWISLQIGAPAPQPPISLVDISAQIADFADTAALMANLDLIVTIDTAVAHLAGALGLHVWTLLPFAPDWRWMLGLEKNAWYPTMRLFRQPRPGDWGNVLKRIAAELNSLSAHRASGGAS